MKSFGFSKSFFTSDRWPIATEHAPFSKKEALVDLIACITFDLVGEEPFLFFGHRWGWLPDEVDTFVRSVGPLTKVKGLVLPDTEDPALIRQLHAMYCEAFDRALRMIPARKTAYGLLIREHLKNEPDPEALWARVIRAVQGSEHHMSDRRYHDPASFLRNAERREYWIQSNEHEVHHDTIFDETAPDCGRHTCVWRGLDPV